MPLSSRGKQWLCLFSLVPGSGTHTLTFFSASIIAPHLVFCNLSIPYFHFRILSGLITEHAIPFVDNDAERMCIVNVNK